MPRPPRWPFLALVAALIGGCSGSSSQTDPTNHAPLVTGLGASAVTLEPGQAIQLEASAVDPDGDVLTFAWSAPAGSFSPADAATTAWSAPAFAGGVSLTCTVSDPAGEQAALSISVTVAPSSADRDGDGVTVDLGDCDDLDDTVYPGAIELADGQDNDCDGQADEGSSLYDDDGDGYSGAQGDCDDGDDQVHPGVPDPIDGVDNDCDGAVDEGSSASDDDRDGFTEDDVPDGDCDDGRPDVYPGATELPDSADNDCDGLVDEGTALYDDDGDGSSEVQGDCDDSRPSISADATEQPDGQDNDCDGIVDEGTPAQDLDGDGYPLGEPGETDPGEPGTSIDPDCDDLDATVYPGAIELADARDNDCDGVIDDGTAVYDDDGDGFVETGDASSPADCDDADPAVYPGAMEAPDGVDQDCDGLVDDGTTAYDDDGDGVTEDGHATGQEDCDDADPRRRPGYPEVPDGIDNDCDGVVDEGTVLADADEDGYTVLGDGSSPGDCDDNDPTVYPGAVDLPDDGVANDCAGATQNQPPVAAASIAGAASECASITLDGSASVDPEGQSLAYAWYFIDGPGTLKFGSASAVSTTLAWKGEGAYRVGLAVSDGVLTGEELILELDTAQVRRDICGSDGDGDGITAADGDCDDDDPSIYPGAIEVCDHVDQDCDGRELLFDESFDAFDPKRWVLGGSAAVGTGDVVLTEPTRSQTGSVFYAAPVDLLAFSFTAEFELWLEGGTSGNGMTFAVIDADGETLPALGGGDGGLGLVGLSGWGIELDTNPEEEYGDTGSDHVAVDRAEDLYSIPETVYPRAGLRTGTVFMQVRYDAGTITVIKNSVTLFTVTPDWKMPARGYIGFTAATGTETDRHHVLRASYECR